MRYFVTLLKTGKEGPWGSLFKNYITNSTELARLWRARGSVALRPFLSDWREAAVFSRLISGGNRSPEPVEGNAESRPEAGRR